MANIMTKSGSQDNILTYEHICDTTADMANIERKYKTLGSTCIVITGESGGIEVYIADQNGEWKAFESAGSSGIAEPSLSIHICTQDEVSNGLPNIAVPEENTIYFVASSEEENNLYTEYVYVNNAWEKMGGVTLDLSNYATKAELPTNVSDLTNDAGYLTQHQDISGKANSADLATVATSGSYNDLSNKPTIPSLSGYATETYVTNAIGNIDLSVKADKANTVLDNTLSMNRKANSTVGALSVAVGWDNTASGAMSFAEGSSTIASGAQAHAEGVGGQFSIGNTTYTSGATGPQSHSEGNTTLASGGSSHAEGYQTRATEMYTHAEGYQTLASGQLSHAEGSETTASGQVSHAEGSETIANGTMSHAEGYSTTAGGMASHAEGKQAAANGSMSHAEGFQTITSGSYSHAEGNCTIATGSASHVNGQFNIADSYNDWPTWAASTEYKVGDKIKVTTTVNNESITKGYICKTAHTSSSTFSTTNWNEDTKMNYAVIVGGGTDTNNRKNIYTLDWDGKQVITGSMQIGQWARAKGTACLSIGNGSNALGTNSVAVGAGSSASGTNAIAIGGGATASGSSSTAIGSGTRATGLHSIALGGGTLASGNHALAMGNGSVASGVQSHAEGGSTNASGSCAHAEGSNTVAEGDFSHAEGDSTTASGDKSHAEGYSTFATGHLSHAEGGGTTASGASSHAEGGGTIASGEHSHAEGASTIAIAKASHVEGTCNIQDNYDTWVEWTATTKYEVGDKVKVTTVANNATTVKGYICKTAHTSGVTFANTNWNSDGKYNFVHIVGNGTTNGDRSNAYALGWDGTGHFAGNVYVGCNSDSTGGSKLATETYVTSALANAGGMSDVQLDGTSILSSGVANIPMASYQNKGVVKVSSDYGIRLNDNGYLTFNTGNDPTTKLGGSYNHAVLVGSQHVSTFYGLAKVAGVDLAQSGVDADEEIGHYPETAKAAIRTLIGAGTYSKPSGGIPASDLDESIPRFVYRITFNSYQFQCTIAETGAGKTVSIDPDLYESFFTGPADLWITTADEQDILYFEGLSIVKDNISGIITSEQTNTNGEPKLEMRIPFAPRGNYEVILRLDQSFDNTAKVIFSQSKDVNTGIDSNLDLYTMSSKVATEDYVNARIPAPPSADGTYTLQLTVTSGEATYAWV